MVMDTLSPEDQQIIRDAAQEAGELNRQMVKDQTESLKGELEAFGIKFNEVDPAPFVEATQPVYEKWRGQFPDLVDEIVAAAKAAGQ